MPARPVFHPDLGRFFESLRLERKWGQSEAADMARRRGLKAATRQILLRLETGKTKWPSPAVLRDVAALYSKPYAELVKEVTRQAYFQDGATHPVSPHGLPSPSHLQPGDGTDVISAAQIDLQQRLETLEAENARLRKDVRAYGEAIIELADSKADAAPGGTSRGGRRRGKTH